MAIPVYWWPQTQARDALQHQGLVVIGLRLPSNTDRATARTDIRAALQTLHHTTAHQGRYQSISHEEGVSVGAVCSHSPVGIDIVRIPEAADWRTDLIEVARGYLGPMVVQELVRLTPQEQAHHFARAWADNESRLKCRGLGLVEWSAQRHSTLATCTTQTLGLPLPWVGSVSICSDKKPL